MATPLEHPSHRCGNSIRIGRSVRTALPAFPQVSSCLASNLPDGRAPHLPHSRVMLGQLDDRREYLTVHAPLPNNPAHQVVERLSGHMRVAERVTGDLLAPGKGLLCEPTNDGVFVREAGVEGRSCDPRLGQDAFDAQVCDRFAAREESSGCREDLIRRGLTSPSADRRLGALRSRPLPWNRRVIANAAR